MFALPMSPEDVLYRNSMTLLGTYHLMIIIRTEKSYLLRDDDDDDRHDNIMRMRRVYDYPQAHMNILSPWSPSCSQDAYFTVEWPYRVPSFEVRGWSLVCVDLSKDSRGHVVAHQRNYILEAFFVVLLRNQVCAFVPIRDLTSNRSAMNIYLNPKVLQTQQFRRIDDDYTLPS